MPEQRNESSAASSFESAHPEIRSEPADRLGRESMVTVWDHEGRYVGCMGVELWRDLLDRDGDMTAAYSSRWEHHADLIRTQIQETGRVRIAFLTLADLVGAMNDLGISLHEVEFKDGWAVVKS
jgi:hypothetical protein